ncbi:protein E6-like [Andrographis paniculata]|uniref:protein E6-like n=1 Tax=Andrographis paniculata TaxID=175694 RepID=UPI0021E7E547|nr:protein E6-like [Andrographis paniculata]
MASPASQIPFFFFFFFILFTLLPSYTQARDSQLFNKLPSTTNNDVVPTQNQPDFIPDTENSYGLYGHESGQLPPSTTTATPQFTESDQQQQPPRKYLPKNYNPVAYVTQPEEINDSVSIPNEEKTFPVNPNGFPVNPNEEKTFPVNPNGFPLNPNEEKTFSVNTDSYNGAAEHNFYNPQQDEDDSAYRNYAATTSAAAAEGNNNDFYYNGGNSFNSEPQSRRGNYPNGGFQPSDTSFNSRENYFNGGFQPQGMSDTRFIENGKYFYDLNSQKYSSNHPYESLKGARPTATGYTGSFGGADWDRENINGGFP